MRKIQATGWLLALAGGVVILLAAFAPETAPKAADELPALKTAGGGVTPSAGPADEVATEITDIRAFEIPPIGRWETFGVKDGLPSDKAFAIRLDGDRVWVGTDNGLAVLDREGWRSYGVEDGLPHRVILSLDVSPRTGDLWIATMGGLARFSAGRFDVFNQINSGLSNDFVNNVRCDPNTDEIWAATAMGASRLNLKNGSWETFDHRNTPMHEPWTYSTTPADGKIYVGAWGAGVLEYTPGREQWREYRDPDKEFEIDLFPDDGPVSDITSSVDFAGGKLWQATYTGLASYDGREWRSYYAEDSGLASNFVNFVRAWKGYAFVGTDQGLSFTDGDQWVTYRRGEDGQGNISFFSDKKRVFDLMTSTALAHNYVLGVDVREDEIWVATGNGVSRGRLGGVASPPRAVGARTVSRTGPLLPETSPKKRFSYAGTPDALLPYRDHPPYLEFFKERTAFRGAGRELEVTDKPAQIHIGFIGPLEDQDNPILPPGFRSGTVNSPKAVYGRRMLRAATMAIEEANEQGGYQGTPFRLMPRSDLVLWGQTSNELVRFVQEDKVWAVLSSIDSNHNHVLSRTSIKAEIPIVSAGSTDPTLVEHSVPWLVRCIPDDRQESYALLNEILVQRGLKRVAMLRVNDRDGRTGVSEFMQGARRLGHPVVIEQRFENGDTVFIDQMQRIMQTNPDALVIWGNPTEAGLAVKQVREGGTSIPIFGFDRMASGDFLALAGAAAEGVVVAATLNPDRKEPRWQAFRDRYQRSWGEEPDPFAAYAYDGMNLIIRAVHKAGLNRARIRDVLFEVEKYEGVTGTIRFDTNMNNIAPPWLAEVKHGRFQYRAAPSWPDSGSETLPSEHRLAERNPKERQ